MRTSTSKSIITQAPEKSSKIFSGVFILTLSGLLVKVIGLIFKIPISHLLLDEGMGYFNAAYTIYAWLYMLSSAGLPVAISILVSSAVAKNNIALAKRVGKISIAFFGAIGLLGSFFMFLFASHLSKSIGNPNSKYAIFAIAPALFFVCISSAIRGYYQGMKNMNPTAFSQLIESAGKLVVGILMAFWAIRQGYPSPIVAGFSIIGVSVGSFLAMLYLLFAGNLFYSEKEYTQSQEPIQSRQLIGKIIRVALPITISSSVMSLTNLIDLGMIMRRLQSIGYSVEESSALYGNYTTLVVPMFNLPSIFIYPIAYAIVPSITDALAKQKRSEANQIGALSLISTSIIAMPMALGIGAFSYPILSLIFTKTSAHIAAPLLSVQAPGIFFICVLAVTNSILAGYGEQTKPIISMLFGGVTKIIAGYVLIGIDGIGIMGAPIATLLCYVVAAVCNFMFLVQKKCELPSAKSMMIMPIINSSLSVGIALGVYKIMMPMVVPSLCLIASIIAAVLVYIFLLIKMNILEDEIMQMIPMGHIFAKYRKRKIKISTK